jgi:hypothetical protein
MVMYPANRPIPLDIRRGAGPAAGLTGEQSAALGLSPRAASFAKTCHTTRTPHI